MNTKVAILVAAVAALLLGAAGVVYALQPSPIFVGAVYPTTGGQGPGGIEEYRGVELAAQLTNREGGVHGRPIQLHLIDTESANNASASVATLAGEGAQVIVGSYGSTISFPAAEASYNRGKVFWENGAVGDLGMLAAQVPPEYMGTKVFRFPPAGTVLGSSAIDFVSHQLASELPDRPLHYTVAYVDDAYGQEVSAGAIKQLATLGVSPTVIPYDLNSADYASIAAQIAAAHTDVLFVASYLDDAVQLRQQILAQKVPLLVNIGTSSSYCLPEFGAQLGSQAVGLFASDKPDGAILKTDNLTPTAKSELDWARQQYAAQWGGSVSAAALTGFAGGLALFHYVLPGARSLTPDGIAAAARSVQLPMGALPNGSGMDFGPAGAVSAGENLAALSVIWEWTSPGVRQIVYPPAYATNPIVDLPASNA